MVKRANSGNKNEWLKKAKGNKLIARLFGKKRYEVQKILENEHVSRAQSVQTSLVEFLKDPKKFTEALNRKFPDSKIRLFVEGAPGTNCSRIRFKNLTPAQLLRTVKEKLEPIKNKQDYIVTLVEAPKLKLQGNVIVEEPENFDDKPSVIGEFVKGNGQPLSRPGITPEFLVWTDPVLGNFRYSDEDATIRSTLYKGLRCIPTVHDGDKGRPLPGYYEIGFVEDEPSKPYVYDMRPFEMN